jgi:hypothetical protein
LSDPKRRRSDGRSLTSSPAAFFFFTIESLARSARAPSSRLNPRTDKLHPRFHWIIYVFGAILIYTVRFDPFIVYTSHIFAILALRAMYFLLCQTRLKVIRRMLLGFALVLLSMFFFYFSRGGCTLVACRCIAAVGYCLFFCFAHGPPFTRLHSSGPNTAHLARPRPDPPRVDRGPHTGLTGF